MLTQKVPHLQHPIAFAGTLGRQAFVPTSHVSIKPLVFRILQYVSWTVIEYTCKPCGVLHFPQRTTVSPVPHALQTASTWHPSKCLLPWTPWTQLPPGTDYGRNKTMYQWFLRLGHQSSTYFSCFFGIPVLGSHWWPFCKEAQQNSHEEIMWSGHISADSPVEVWHCQLPDMWIKMFLDDSSPYLLSGRRLSVFALQARMSLSKSPLLCAGVSKPQSPQTQRMCQILCRVFCN